MNNYSLTSWPNDEFDDKQALKAEDKQMYLFTQISLPTSHSLCLNPLSFMSFSKGNNGLCNDKHCWQNTGYFSLLD